MPTNKRSKGSQVKEVLDYALVNPKDSFKTITALFDLGQGTLTNWLKPRALKGQELSSLANIHPAVQKWMKDHGPEWTEVRPRNTLGPAIMKIVTKAARRATFSGNQADPLTSGLGPVVVESGGFTDTITRKPEAGEIFQPQTAGDLVVLEKEVEGMLDKAKAAVNHLESILTSIRITVEWTREVDGRLSAERKVRELENQVSLADKVAKEAQTQMLNDKIKDSFGSR